VLFRLHVPQLLQADAVDLRVLAFAQAVARLELPPELPAAAFREQGVLAMELHAGLIRARLLALPADPHVAGRDALDRVPFIEDLRGREAGEDLHAGRLRLLAEPARERAQADHVVAVVPEAAREHERRRLQR
jgi:hypothetical protein